MRIRIAIALAMVLSAFSPAPGISSAADIGDGHDRFHDALSTSVISATVPGPSTPNSIASATTATCARHDVLIGGGTLEANRRKGSIQPVELPLNSLPLS